MSNVKKSDDYEVGYGKPPKHTQFRKGVSGNVNGRRKKAPDFHAELIKEAKSLITITENGKRIRISKSAGIAKQLTNGAVSGKPHALRTFLEHYLEATEKAAQLESQNVKEVERKQNPKKLSDDELIELLRADLKHEMGGGTCQNEIRRWCSAVHGIRVTRPQDRRQLPPETRSMRRP